METNYKEYYNKSMNEGEEYQEFVADALCEKFNIKIEFYKTKHEQYNIGESKQGFEIKYDKKLKETNNLWIEIAEKTNPKNKDYIPSGIYREDNSYFYCIGDYNIIFVFTKEKLKKILNENKYKIMENNTKTSKGFLLNIFDAYNYCSYCKNFKKQRRKNEKHVL